MFRTFAACVATAAVTAAVTTSVGLGSRSASTPVKTIPAGGAAIFAGRDLICNNESALGSGGRNQPGVGCASYASPYHGVGIWVTRATLAVTRPPNQKVVATFRR